MLKKPVTHPPNQRQDAPCRSRKSERRLAVRFGTLSPLSDARTTLASFFSILLVFDFRFGEVADHH